MAPAKSTLEAVSKVLKEYESLAIAVSGGVDSMTLAHAAYHAMPRESVRVFHAISPAVTRAASERVNDHANLYGWDLTTLNAGEFNDPNYLKNPLNRCYFCKSNLYDRIRGETDSIIASGANMDDLRDYRPGLLAAKERSVIHPFTMADFSKDDVRRLAREFGLDGISELPAQPCMASRIETGIAVNPEDLFFIEDMEQSLAELAPLATLRCRIVRGGVRLEVSDEINTDLDMRREMIHRARKKCTNAGKQLLEVTPYRKGSAFLHDT